MQGTGDAGPVLYRKAQAFQAAGDLSAARACYEQALRLLPDDTNLLRDFAALCAIIGDETLVIGLLRRVVARGPGSGLEGTLGFFLAKHQAWAEAGRHLGVHLREQPGDEKAWRMLARCFLQQALPDKALSCAAEADRLCPSLPAMDLALEALGLMNRRDDIEDCLAEALRRYPDDPRLLAHKGLHLLRQWRIREGFRHQPEIRARFWLPLPGNVKIAASQWEGDPFDGILLVSGEQGVGEEVLGASFFSSLVAMGQRTVVECDPRLIPIFSRSFPEITFTPPHPGNPGRLTQGGTALRRIKALDLAPLMYRREDFVQPFRWLKPDEDRVGLLREQYCARWPEKRLVGLSWRSVRARANRTWKSIRIEELFPILSLPDTIAIDVQYKGTEAERQRPVAHGLPPLFHDDTIDAFNDLDGLLAQLCALDTLVTVSNTTAHFAGAAGLPGHVILPREPPVYVYWGYQGGQSPWYPSLRLWRPQQFQDMTALARTIATTIAETGH